MKNAMKLVLLFFALLLTVEHSLAQCDQESNPNKWLYKNGLGRYKVSYPQTVDYSTKITKFFDAVVFMGLYSFVKAGNDRLFYLQFFGPASYPYDINETDSLEFYFANKEVLKLPPQTKYPGEKGALISFYKVDKEFLGKMAVANLDSIVLKFTPNPKNKPEDESKLLHTYTFRKFSSRNVKLFKEYANCFRNEY